VSASLSHIPQSDDSSRKTDVEKQNKIDKKEKEKRRTGLTRPVENAVFTPPEPRHITCRYAIQRIYLSNAVKGKKREKRKRGIRKTAKRDEKEDS